MAKKKIEEKYTSMSEREHILQRSGMYVGSTQEQEYSVFVYDDEIEKMTRKDATYSSAMLKLFAEILENSCDEFRRKDNLGLTTVEVTIDKDTNYITVKDNGGIPVVMHKDANMYVAEFIFGQLRTSSNYNDDEDRNGIGTNGLGSVISNIFSKEFRVTSCDGKNKIQVSWSDNMAKKSVSLITKSSDHYTETQFLIDFSRFDQQAPGLTNDFVMVLHKKCIDAAAANIGLKVVFNVKKGKNKISKTWKFKKFEEYMELYSDFYDESCVLPYKDNKKQFWICPDSQVDVAFVNGAECSKGTHIQAVKIPICHAISEVLKKKNKIDVTAKGISNKFGIFGIFDISNPTYDSQTKECLTNSEESFYKDGSRFAISTDFLKKVQKSEIVELVVDWYKKKVEAEDQAKIRKLNREAKKLLRSDKFINCNSKKNYEKELWIFEGDSAATAIRTSRNPMTQAGYLMRGVPKNVIGLSATQVMKNEVFNDIITILGLQWGQYNKKEDLRFGKIIFASDMDPDGDKIASLLALWASNWPELFDQNLVYRCVSPIIVASKGKKGTKSYITKSYYTFNEYHKDEKNLKGYEIKHVKGLGTLNKEQSDDMFQHTHLYKFEYDKDAGLMLKKWFGKGDAEGRKNMLKDSVEAE